VIRLAKANPGKLSYATLGVGTVLQLTMELVKDKSNTFMVHVPYRGGGQIVTDLIGNQVDLAMLISVSAAPHINAGKLKGIAVNTGRRIASLPGVATVAESAGFSGFSMVAWTGLFAPAQTPPAITEKLNRELMEVLRMDEIRTKLADGGATPGAGSVADFAQFVRNEHSRYAAIVKTANIKD
jgi:tripartite-type tricarboxylate transporter receptor subunit TctC